MTNSILSIWGPGKTEVISHEQKRLLRLTGTSLEVQWLQLYASTAVGTGSIPDHETKIPHATQCSLKKKKRLAEIM